MLITPKLIAKIIAAGLVYGVAGVIVKAIFRGC
jgi:hypothetical protein